MIYDMYGCSLIVFTVSTTDINIRSKIPDNFSVNQNQEFRFSYGQRFRHHLLDFNGPNLVKPLVKSTLSKFILQDAEYAPLSNWGIEK